MCLEHKVVNLSVKFDFVEPESAIHTQHIESDRYR